ncbi:MAG: RNA degradosome polyphosphate kinase [Betaproteobacteria bacterium CG2_30_68_42]|nr:MAG: RNA degradosome polyphosphate kinase [Betaproteobacteria bacterium CG2_30_68_42]PJA58497.1 MAG: polyphosphate kinase 1 [Rhodocyclales bacterium CG_4_9_14_3_um_filter_68_10]
MKAPPRSAYAPEHFLNRELSLLAFNRRVLAQAADAAAPLLERLRFACIVSSNLDEFFEIRVAGLKEQVRYGTGAPGADGRTAAETLHLVGEEAHRLVADQYALLYDVILPALAARGIVFFRRGQWNEAQQTWIRDYFFREAMPVLTPIGLDPSHPFPRVLNKSLNFAVELEGRDAFGRSGGGAIVQAPRALPRVIRLPRELAGVEFGFVLLSSVLHAHVGELFSGMNVHGCYQFRVTRNSELFVDDEEVKNLRTTLQGELPQRRFGDAVRLEVADNCSPQTADFLLRQFGLSAEDLYRVPGIVNLVRLMEVPERVERSDLKYRPFVPGRPKRLDKHSGMFEVLRRGDLLLHHPYQSFTPVIEFLTQAVDDPAVVAIKMTVYRTGTDSVLMDLLVRAAQKGKEVTVVVELLARFDEEANITIASQLEEVGAHVVYGVFGYKTHAKMMLVVRREQEALRRYVHLGTGNYHTRTAGLYTDFGLLTCDERIGADVNEVFKQLTALGRAGELNHLWQAPFTLHANVIKAIRREAQAARAGEMARIIAKMNALVEPEVIEALYDASRAGVRIDLVVRGVCALRPQVPGLSENIRVRSVVGRFLEHSRIFFFHAGGAQQVYLSSADWMERNFFRRIEACFPVLDAVLRKRVLREGLKPYLRDNVQAWEMDGEGNYRRRASRTARYCAQETLLAELGERA